MNIKAMKNIKEELKEVREELIGEAGSIELVEVYADHSRRNKKIIQAVCDITRDQYAIVIAAFEDTMISVETFEDDRRRQALFLREESFEDVQDLIMMGTAPILIVNID